MSLPYLILGLSALLPISQANPLEARAVCNQDNCYRQISRQFDSNYQSAFTQCSNYGNTRPTVTSYRTATTISIVGSGVLGTHTVFAVTSPFYESTYTYPGPSFATSCPSTGSATGTPNRVQSACACLTAGGYLPSPTTTIYGPAVTLKACDPANNYGAQFSSGYFGVQPFPFSQPQSTRQNMNFAAITSLGTCCTKCFQTPGCLKFQVNTDPSHGPLGCNIYALAKSKNTYDDPICPYGLEGDYTPSSGDYGNGPCDYPLDSDE